MQNVNDKINIIRRLLSRKYISTADAKRITNLDDDNFYKLYGDIVKKEERGRNILVTGGAGFIGSNFIRYWLNKYSSSQSRS